MVIAIKGRSSLYTVAGHLATQSCLLSLVDGKGRKKQQKLYFIYRVAEIGTH